MPDKIYNLHLKEMCRQVPVEHKIKEVGVEETHPQKGDL